MIEFTTDPEKNKIANEQLEYFVNKFKQNQNEYVLRAKAEAIIRKALRNWNPGYGNLKTYLSSQLQQLSREFYKNQPVYVPENQQLLMYKAKKIIDDYKDTYGGLPNPTWLAKKMNITENKAKNLLQLYGGVAKAQFETDEYLQAKNISITPKEIIDSIPDPTKRNIAKDMYLKQLSKEQLFKKYGFKQTKFYSIKKEIDNHISQYAEAINSYE